MQIVTTLGRQPALGLAELESLFGAANVRPLGTDRAAALIEFDGEAGAFPYSRLGGSLRAARLLTSLDATDWRDIQRYLVDTVPGHLQYVPEGKLKLGLSVFGLPVRFDAVNRTGLELKKVIRKTGRSVRIVQGTALELSSAQVIHNQLTGPTGWELLLIRDGGRTILAQTFAVQDIEAYGARDQARPKRDARVGMLPPKLAQIIVNLAAGQLPSAASHQLPAGKHPDETQPAGLAAQHPTVLDPFCGTGVVLQEALLMGYRAYGSDLEPRMIEYSRANLDWLLRSGGGGGSPAEAADAAFILEPGDATSHWWEQPFDMVAAETYLGAPLTSVPDPGRLSDIIRTGDLIHRKFLRNLAPQLQPGTRLCLAVPAWRAGDGFKHLDVLGQLKELGYERLTFQNASDADLIYYRDNQLVARELVVLVRR